MQQLPLEWLRGALRLPGRCWRRRRHGTAWLACVVVGRFLYERMGTAQAGMAWRRERSEVHSCAKCAGTAGLRCAVMRLRFAQAEHPDRRWRHPAREGPRFTPATSQLASSPPHTNELTLAQPWAAPPTAEETTVESIPWSADSNWAMASSLSRRKAFSSAVNSSPSFFSATMISRVWDLCRAAG